jgi:hypothetical protein
LEEVTRSAGITDCPTNTSLNERLICIEDACRESSYDEHKITGNAEAILTIQHHMSSAYDRIWRSLSDQEKFILYDFALDGFTNYKNLDVLAGLYERGLLRREPKHKELVLYSYSFRNYLLAKGERGEMNEIEKKIETGSAWKDLKNLLFILFFAFIIFLFLTQQEAYNKILALISALVAFIPLLLKLFDRNFFGTAGSKSDKI